MKVHVIGGAGMFDTVSNFFKRLISSNAAKGVAKSVASTIARASKTDIGKTALAAAKTAGLELAKTGINTAKDVAIARGKQLIDRGGKRLTPQSIQTIQTIQQLTGLTPNVPVLTKQLTQQSKDILAGLANAGANASASAAEINLNNLIGSGIQRNNAIAIQDLVKRMNTGAGLRLATG